jgi:Tfp pilus assembly protein PilF
LQGVLALCVLGIKQNNPTLVKAAISEMDKKSSKADIVAMKALVMALQGNQITARHLISRAIHVTPQDAGLWKAMTVHLLNHDKKTKVSSAAAKCAQKAASLYQSSSTSSSVEMMSLVGLCLLNVDQKSARREAMKAVHSHPQFVETWSVLVASWSPGDNHAQKIVANAKIIAANDSNSNSSLALQQWLVQ